MFSIVRQGTGWVLRADGADLLVVRSKSMAKRIVRDASDGERGRGADAAGDLSRARPASPAAAALK